MHFMQKPIFIYDYRPYDNTLIYNFMVITCKVILQIIMFDLHIVLIIIMMVTAHQMYTT